MITRIHGRYAIEVPEITQRVYHDALPSSPFSPRCSLAGVIAKSRDPLPRLGKYQTVANRFVPFMHGNLA
jgi:hypothetical protein